MSVLCFRVISHSVVLETQQSMDLCCGSKFTFLMAVFSQPLHTMRMLSPVVMCSAFFALSHDVNYDDSFFLSKIQD